MSKSTGPQINDDYWFSWSKQHLDDALERRNAAFSKLQNLVLWLWGIYTTFSAVGFALSTRDLELTTVIVISTASILLISVYWACVWGQMPIPVEFDPRSPTEISEAHYCFIQKKDGRLKITMFLSLLAAASVGIALLTAGTSRGAGTFYLDVNSTLISQNRVNIAVTARIKKKTTATLNVYTNPKSKDLKKEIQNTYLSSNNGLMQASLKLPEAINYQIKVTWQDGETERSMSRIISSAEAISK